MEKACEKALRESGFCIPENCKMCIDKQWKFDQEHELISLYCTGIRVREFRFDRGSSEHETQIVNAFCHIGSIQPNEISLEHGISIDFRTNKTTMFTNKLEEEVKE